MRPRFWQALKIFFFLTLFLSSILSLVLIKKLETQIDATNADVSKSTRLIDKNTNLIIHALVAEKVEALTKDKHSEEEKVIAIAEWVSRSITNRQAIADKLSDSAGAHKVRDKGFETYFAFRRGVCGARSLIFTEMVKYLNIPVNRYSICCFPTRERGHTAVQVFYNNSWHFFDVTCAGYFRKNGKILSFEEIIELAKSKEDHLKYLVVFPASSDYYPAHSGYYFSSSDDYTLSSGLKKIDNREQMQGVYARDNLVNASDYGTRRCAPKAGNDSP